MLHKNSSRKPVGRRKPALWVKAYPKQVRPPKSKPATKKRPSDSSRQRQYRKDAEAFIKKWPMCACHVDLLKYEGVKCSEDSSEVHHMRGRLGPLLLDQRFWVPVCRKAHAWIDANRKKARQYGWLCQKGEWNSMPPFLES